MGRKKTYYLKENCRLNSEQYFCSKYFFPTTFHYKNNDLGQTLHACKLYDTLGNTLKMDRKNIYHLKGQHQNSVLKMPNLERM